MKVANFASLIAVVALCLNGGAWAAPPGSKADCSQNMVLTEVQPLEFGGFFANGAGTVTIDPTGVRTFTGLITLAASGGNSGQQGIIEVGVATANDCTAHLIGINLPQNVTLSDAVGNTLTINTWVSSPVDGVASLGPNNAPVQVNIGATANTVAGQVGGLYTGTYTVRITFQ